MIQTGYSVQSIIFYIEKEIAQANSLADLKMIFADYYRGLSQTVTATAQAKAS